MRIAYHGHDEIRRAIRGLEAAASEHALEPELLERARVSAAQLNGFARYVEMQAKDALSALRADERFPLVGVWGHAPICSERERAALVCGDELTLLAEHDVPDTLHESVRTGFSGDELCSLTLVTSTVRRWDRFADAFRAPVGNYVARADAAQH